MSPALAGGFFTAESPVILSLAAVVLKTSELPFLVECGVSEQEKEDEETWTPGKGWSGVRRC